MTLSAAQQSVAAAYHRLGRHKKVARELGTTEQNVKQIAHRACVLLGVRKSRNLAGAIEYDSWAETFR